MQNKSIIILGLTLITVSNIIGHFAGPFSIFITPILLTIIIAGINYNLYKSNFHLTVLYNFGLLIFNDLFIRFFAGGTHDQVGKALISISFTIAFILSIITMAIYSFNSEESQIIKSKTKKVVLNIFSVVFLATLIGIAYIYFISEI